jgi:hypothetical protein
MPLDAEVARRDVGPVTVLYEETAEAPSQARSAIVEHGQRIVALAERVPMLPIRYGTTVADDDELLELVGMHVDEWSRRLAQLAGRCELVVHLDLRDVAPRTGPIESGRAYLEARRERLRRHDDAVADVRRVLAPWADESRLLPDGRRLAVLVERTEAAAAREAVATWGDEQPDIAVVVSGPWPPFSFCEEPEQ